MQFRKVRNASAKAFLIAVGYGLGALAFTPSSGADTPIAAIQADPLGFLSQSVTVVGQVYIPTNYRGSIGSGYIQDTSGRGINLFGSSANHIDLHTIGNRVSITGEVAIFSLTTVEILNISVITLLSSGTRDVPPVQLETGAAANARWEGTFIESRGTISAITLSGTSSSYTINDGTGALVIRVFNTLGAPSFTVGQNILARGAGNKFNSDFYILVGTVADIVMDPGGADTTPPVFVGAWAPLFTVVEVTFNEAMESATAGAPTSYEVFETATPEETFAVNNVMLAGPVATLTIDGNLAIQTNYTVRVTSVRDTEGNQIAVPLTGAFQMGGTVDTTPPTLASALAPSLTSVTATFSEPIDTLMGGTATNYLVFETVNPSNTFTAGSASVAGTVATLSLSRSLTAGTNYTLRCQSVMDLAGNTMVGQQTTAFTTAGSPPPPLGIYADEMGMTQPLCIEQNVLKTLYLLGKVPNHQPPGVTGAEFRIEVSNATGYYFFYSPPSGAQSYGSPFDVTPSNPNDPTGTALFFSSCQSPSPFLDSFVDFGQVNVLNTAGGTTTLRIRAKQPPGSPSMECPRFFLCDAPLNTPICMSPVVSGDIVFEVTLNPEVCLPPPFTTENLQLDTHEASNDGAAGPVNTSQSLDHRQWFLVTVQGTVSLTNSSSWAMPPNVVCMIPEPSPQTASPGVTNYWVGADAETNFAAALSPGSDCSAMEALGYPRHHTRFQADLGSGFMHLEPLGGAPSDPGPSHRYRFLVQGQDNPAFFRWEEAQTSDNYGVLSIRIEEVNPTDVDMTVETTPRPNHVLILASVPDPFNPTTMIRYVLPTDSEVVVELYDVRGHAIRRLFSGRQGRGYNSVLWDGLLASGRPAPSGIYFARVTTPSGSATERVTLVK